MLVAAGRFSAYRPFWESTQQAAVVAATPRLNLLSFWIPKVSIPVLGAAKNAEGQYVPVGDVSVI